MTPEQMHQQIAARNAILSELNRIGLRVLAGSEDQILKWFSDKGVVTSTANGYLEMKQSDGSDVTPSRACMTLRSECPQLFASNPRYDKISSLEDFGRGTERERMQARSQYISEHGLDAFEALPRTRAEATLRSAEVSPSMTKREWLALKTSEKIRAIEAFGENAPDVIAVIMRRDG